MIRVVLFLILVGLAALATAWLADRPGDVIITWYGYRIETSVMVLTAAIAALIVVGVFLWSMVRAVLNSPYLLARFVRDRRGVRAYQAISKGLVAVGAGDTRAARKFAAEARRIAASEPLALLLAAQTAQLSGDRPAAEEAFRTMAGRDDTKLLGLHGLFVEAQRRGDARAARAYAEEAVQSGAASAWAGQAVLEFRCAAADWVGALAALERNYKSGLLDKEAYRRQRAVLVTARAIAAEESDRDRAKPLALEAVKLAPSLVPAAALAGRLLAEAGDLRRAGRILERAWREHPHPDLAETYAHLRIGDSARERLARVEALATKAPGHVESALAVARAAIDAGEFAKARAALTPHLRAPTQRIALLMAELEQAEHGDEGRAREWTARAVHAQRDPAWTADGIVSDRWLPVSPVSGRIDAFEWKVPLAELAAPVTMSRESEREALALIEAEQAAATMHPEAVEASIAGEQAEPPPDTAEPAPAASPRPEPAGAARTAAPAPARRVEAVIPLAHAPDDPGPDAPAETAQEPQPETWHRLR